MCKGKQVGEKTVGKEDKGEPGETETQINTGHFFISLC